MLIGIYTAHSKPVVLAIAAVARRVDIGTTQAQVVRVVIIVRRTRPIVAVRTGIERRATATVAGEFKIGTIDVLHVCTTFRASRAFIFIV